MNTMLARRQYRHDNNIDDIERSVYVKDLFLHPQAPLHTLVRKTLFIPDSAYQVLEKIKNTRIQHAFIVNEYGSYRE